MKKVTTLLGEATINRTGMNLAGGHGQYKIFVDYEFEGKNKTLYIHSTDSQLYDKQKGEDDYSQIVLEGAQSKIENALKAEIESM